MSGSGRTRKWRPDKDLKSRNEHLLFQKTCPPPHPSHLLSFFHLSLPYSIPLSHLFSPLLSPSHPFSFSLSYLISLPLLFRFCFLHSSCVLQPSHYSRFIPHSRPSLLLLFFPSSPLPHDVHPQRTHTPPSPSHFSCTYNRQTHPCHKILDWGKG